MTSGDLLLALMALSVLRAISDRQSFCRHFTCSDSSRQGILKVLQLHLHYDTFSTSWHEESLQVKCLQKDCQSGMALILGRFRAAVAALHVQFMDELVEWYVLVILVEDDKHIPFG